MSRKFGKGWENYRPGEAAGSADKGKGSKTKGQPGKGSHKPGQGSYQAGWQADKGWKGQAEKCWKGQTGSSGWGTEMERTGQTGGMHGIGFYRGVPFATVSLVGESGPLPDWEPYQSRFRPLRQDRSTRLTAEYRSWGYRLSGFCLAPCPVCQEYSCSRPVTTDSETSHASHVCGGCYRPAWEASQTR